MGVLQGRRAVAGVVAAALLATLVVSAPASAVTDDNVGRERWTTEQRIAHGLKVAPALEGGTTPIPLAEPEKATLEDEPAPMPTERPGKARWPKATSRTVNVPVPGARPARVDGVVMIGRSSAAAPSLVRLRVHDRAAAEDAGIDGVLLDLEPATAAGKEVAEQPLDVSVDYSSFSGAYGGDWASRLRLVRLPDCALTTPKLARCRTQTPIESTNDLYATTVKASLAPASAGVVALAAAPSGAAGNWSATPLSPSASWQVSGQTGDFSWSYPLRTPPGVGGPEPELALSYSSGSLDGKVASTNNQTSWIGDGWDMTTGFVERKYVGCAEDTASGASNATRKTGDLCWASDNATLAFGGRSGELVKDAATGTWRLQDDDGTRVERLTGGWNGDNDGEHWKITTTDGTQYWFGRGRRSASDPVALNSAWTVPVYGNHPGDPCYNATFASGWCNQAWRWNLEYVVDSSGNSLTYVYETESNAYGRNLNQAVSSYVRGGYLNRIEYGQRAGSESATSAPMRVDFAVAERCLPSGAVTCAPAQLTSANASSWPDVPFDQTCASTTTCPEQTSPAFFTRKRLTSVTTNVLMAGSYQAVDEWTLRHTFPIPGDGTDAALWLDSIGHRGLVGSAITLPDVKFHGLAMANRVDKVGDAGPPMNRYRIIAIDSESGAKTTINYLPQDCTTASLPASPDSNTRRCFPVRWQPEGTGPQIQEYFHKYLVDTIVENPNSAPNPAVVTSYVYDGGAAWHYDDNPLVPEKQRTWGEFRGYATVDVLTGAAEDPVRSRQRTRYFRGMDGDRLSNGGTRSVLVDGIADQDRLNGFVREEITYNGISGPEVSGEISTPWVSAPTATAADGTKAAFLETGTVESRTTASSLPGGKRTTRTVTTYDPIYGVPTQVDDQGDVSVPTDDRCTRTEYVRNTGANIVASVMRTETVAVGCGATPSRPGDVITDTLTLYDGGAYGAPPSRGLVTAAQRVKGFTGTTPTYVTETQTSYDAHGREVAVTDVLGHVTTTAYSPATGGPVTSTTVTAPDPDGTGPLTPHVSRSESHPAWGTPVKITDPNGKVTSATFDALGRTTAVWFPGRAQGTKSAHVTYDYTISTTGPNTVTTKRLTATEAYTTTIELFDGMLRPRQTQTVSADRNTPGRLVTDTLYDSRGLVARTNGAWFTNGTPATTVLLPAIAVPSRTRLIHDGAGRPVTEIVDVNEQEFSRTTTTYDGDRVHVDPPVGGVPQTTITDARGRTVELREYSGPGPSGAYQATTYAYDKSNNLVKVTDAAGNAWTSTYDVRGRQTSSSDPDKGTTTSTHDDAGQVVTATDARGETLAYVRDHLGRTTELRDDSLTGSLRARWTYDTLAKGQLTSSARVASGAEYVTAVTGYDDGYRPLGSSVTIPSTEGAIAGTYTTNYTYTVDGQVKTVKLPSAGGLGAETVTTTYDALSKAQSMTGGLGWGTYVATATYDVYGETLRHDLGSTYSFWVTHTYQDGTRRLQRTQVEREGVAGSDMDVAYSYDKAGNPTAVVDSATGKPLDAQCFRYDGMRRLTSAWTPASGSCTASPTFAALGGPAPYWKDYAFDAIGNRTKEIVHTAAGDTTNTYAYPTGTGVARPHGVQSVTRAGAAGAATSTYTYDASGNTTTRNVAAQPGQTLTWDAEGRLETVHQGTAAVGSYLYTPEGERLIRRQNGTTTVYLPGGQELVLTGTTVKAQRYYTFNGQTVATRTGTGSANTSTLISDPHQTASLAIVNSTKAVTQRRMDPFGITRGTPATTWPGDHGFLNKPTDTTGLTQVGARYYDPLIGRFISVDPVMDLTQPQQWAAYTYANGNPVTYWDPTGLAPWTKWIKSKASSLWKNTKSGLSSAWRATSSFVKKYQGEIVGGIAGAAVTAGCLAGSLGAGSVGCLMAGGATAGAVTNLWKSNVQKTQAFSWSRLAMDTGVGAGAGVIGGAAGGVAARIAAQRGGATLTGQLSRAQIAGAQGAAGTGAGTGAAAGATSVAHTSRAIVDARKLDYLFGNVASNAHNAARSAQNAQQLAQVGVHDNLAGRALVSSHLDDVVASSGNIARTFTNEHGAFQVRDSLFAGPGGFLKFESTWRVTGDGLRLTTVIPIGRP